MTDKMTSEQRHYCMSRIRGKDTKPEMLVRRWLWSHGFRYRLHVKWMPGCPDIVMRRLRTVIFVNGCFWHGHNTERVGSEADSFSLLSSECCKLPASNENFWRSKILRNQERDERNYRELQRAGWHVLVVWECWLKPAKRIDTLCALQTRLSEIALSQAKVTYYTTDDEDDLPLAAEPTENYGK